jgi:hypothetical protein
MQNQPADESTAVIPPGRVALTVTTVRYDEPQGEIVFLRESSAEGEFDSALHDALSQRLKGWAIGQVFGRVLARRPEAGEAVEYEGMFSPVRHLLILVQPVDSDGHLGAGEPRQVDIPGLCLPAAHADAPSPPEHSRTPIAERSHLGACPSSNHGAPAKGLLSVNNKEASNDQLPRTEDARDRRGDPHFDTPETC